MSLEDEISRVTALRQTYAVLVGVEGIDVTAALAAIDEALEAGADAIETGNTKAAAKALAALRKLQP